MKKILGILGVAAIVLTLAFNTSFNNTNDQNNDLLLENVIAISEAQAEGTTTQWTCHSSYSDCWFIGCWTIYRCGSPCTTVSCDEANNVSTCTGV